MQWKVGILTLSDKGAKGQREDTSSLVIREMLDTQLFEVTRYEVIPDERPRISQKLLEWSKDLALIVTTGGTGVSPRDVTPEATRDVIEMEIPGMAEAMRMKSLEKTPHAMISRAVVGMKNNCLIINLPGSPKGVRENLEVVLPAIPHALLKIAGDPSDCAVQ